MELMSTISAIRFSSIAIQEIGKKNILHTKKALDMTKDFKAANIVSHVSQIGFGDFEECR